MDGEGEGEFCGTFGAVGAVSGVRNPIRVAASLCEERKSTINPLPLGLVRPMYAPKAVSLSRY